MSKDPLRFIGDGAGFYRYARSNPTTLIDPFGMNARTLTLPGFVGAAEQAGGAAIGVGARILGGAVSVVLQLAVFANATARDEDLLKKDPKPCDRKDDPCYAQYLDDTAWCGEVLTNDDEYKSCMGLNKERCEKGQPRIEPDPRKYYLAR